MTSGFLEQYQMITIDETDPKFQYLSNYNRFQAAKDQGKFDADFITLLQFLKYERMHANRELVAKRLFNLAMSEYKNLVNKELLGANNARLE